MGIVGFDLQTGTISIINNNNSNTDKINRNNDKNTENIINSINSGDNKVIKNITSTDGIDDELNNFFNSGDIYNNLDYSPLSGDKYDKFGNFIIDFVDNVCNTLTSSGSVTYILGFHDNSSIVLNSDDFTLPDGSPFKFFLTLWFYYVIVMIVYLECKKVIDKINEGNELYVLETDDAIGYSYTRYF